VSFYTANEQQAMQQDAFLTSFSLFRNNFQMT